MKHLPILLLFVGASIFTSCKDTYYYGPFDVEFEKNELTISANKDSALFRANFAWHRIVRVIVEQDSNKTTAFPVYPRDSAFTSGQYKYKMYQIDWLTFKRTDDKNAIEVVASPNTGTTRKAKITLEICDSFIPVMLIQKGQK
jgi:hypothetical protein